MTSVANGVYEGTKDFVLSTADAINTIGDGVVDALLHPVATGEKIVDCVAHPIESAKSAGQVVMSAAEHVGEATRHTYDVLVDPNATAGEKARVGTRAFLEVGTMLVGVGGAKAVASGVSVTTQAMKVERLVAATSKGQRVVDALAAADARLGGKSSQLARELTKVAEVPHVADAALKEILTGDHALFRPGATIGNGGTAAAVRHTKETAALVGNSDHIQKLANKQTELTNWLLKNANNANVSAHDVGVARNLLQEITDAQAQLHSAVPHVQNMARAALLARAQEQQQQQREVEKEKKQEEKEAEETERVERVEEEQQRLREQVEEEEAEKEREAEQRQREEESARQAEIESIENELAAEEDKLASLDENVGEESKKADECEKMVVQLESQLKQLQAKDNSDAKQKAAQVQDKIEKLRHRSRQHRANAAKHSAGAQQSRATIASLKSSLQSLQQQQQQSQRARATAR